MPFLSPTKECLRFVGLDEHGFLFRLACTDVNNWDNHYFMSMVIFLHQSMIFLFVVDLALVARCMDRHGQSGVKMK